MKKKIILLIILFLVTGCSANYDIEIYNNTIKEDMEYFDFDSSNWDIEAQYGLTYRTLVTESINYPYPAFNDTIVDENDTIKIEGVEYYNNSTRAYIIKAIPPLHVVQKPVHLRLLQELW